MSCPLFDLSDYKDILGRAAHNDINNDEHLVWSDVV